MIDKFVPYKKWLHQRDEEIKSKYSDTPTEDMAKEMGVDYYTVLRRAKRLGIKKSKAFMHASWKRGGEFQQTFKKEQHKAIDRYLKSHFANMRNEDLAKRFGVNVKTIRRWARRLNLVKSEDFMRKARSSGGSGQKFYTQEQIAWRNQRIAEVFPEGDRQALQRLAEELGISVMHVRQLAYRLGLRHHHFPSQLITDLSEYFPTHTDKECAEHFGISKNSVQHLARKHGWKKTYDDSYRRRSAD
jgi:transposase